MTNQVQISNAKKLTILILVFRLLLTANYLLPTTTSAKQANAQNTQPESVSSEKESTYPEPTTEGIKELLPQSQGDVEGAAERLFEFFQINFSGVGPFLKQIGNFFVWFLKIIAALIEEGISKL